MRSVLKLLTSSLAGLLLAGVAYGQDVQSKLNEQTPSLKRNSLELRPMDVLISAIPGIASAGLSFESYLTHGWTIVADGSYYDVNLSGRQRSIAEDQTDEPVVDTGYGYQAGAGVRVYEDPIGDSGYLGALLYYRELHAKWEFNDERLTSTQFAAIPTVAAGYRWVWNSGFLLRAGISAGLPSVPSQAVHSEPAAVNSRTTPTTDGEKKLSDMLDQQTIVTGDLGIGVMF